jgi:hypothetical protein
MDISAGFGTIYTASLSPKVLPAVVPTEVGEETRLN